MSVQNRRVGGWLVSELETPVKANDSSARLARIDLECMLGCWVSKYESSMQIF